jgi:hypothetical protein
MFLSKPRMALVSALASATLVGSLGMATVPASASTPRHVEVPAAEGAILCNGDLCIQNEGYIGNYVQVNAWAWNKNFFGHFELAWPGGHYANSTPNEWWYGDDGAHVFIVPIVCEYPFTYIATAWRYTGGHYYQDGKVSFGLDIC